LKNIILEKYKSLLLERTLSIHDDYWDNYFDEFYKEWIKDDSSQHYEENFHYYSYYGYNGQEFTNDDEIADQYAIDKIREEYDSIVNSYRSLYKRNSAVIMFRSIRVPENYEEHLKKQGKHLGIYWSRSEESVDVFMPRKNLDKYKFKDNLKVIITATISSEKYINWADTLLANMDKNEYQEEQRGYDDDDVDFNSGRVGETYGEYEKEIRLYKGTPLRILSIHAEDGSELDISEIENKTFYA
jgi:hypothetical protein